MQPHPQNTVMQTIVNFITALCRWEGPSTHAQLHKGMRMCLSVSAAHCGLEDRSSMSTSHDVHTDHTHVHGPSCGHASVQHDDHVDYLHDGHAHHLHGDHYDEHDVSAHLTAEAHDHVHSSDCGHATVQHGDHVDYVHGEHRHAEHGDHYDEH